MRIVFHLLSIGILVPVLILMSGGCGMNQEMNSVKYAAVQTVSVADVMHKKIYTVTGQILNSMGDPVPDCGIYLIKRKINLFETQSALNRSENILSRAQITQTDSQGQYYLTFEPGPSNDVWLAVVDSTGRYGTRAVRLNEKLGDTLLEYPGVSPVIVDLILEP